MGRVSLINTSTVSEAQLGVSHTGRPGISTQHSKSDTSRNGQVTTALRPSTSLRASSSGATSSHTKGVCCSSSTDSSHKTTPAIIAGSVIGPLASVVVFALLFFFWRRRKYCNMASDNTSGDNGPGMIPISNPHLTSILTSSTRTRSSESITSELLAIPRRLSQSSRNAYEDEIERLQQQIRYMEEEIDLMHSGSPPPSYRSSPRSDISDPFELSSSPPPSPSREIAR